MKPERIPSAARFSRIAATACGGVFHEVSQASAAAQSHNSYRSRTGVKVGKDSALNACGQDIEKGLAQAIAGWPGG